MLGLAFTATSYSVAPILAVPLGRIRFCAVDGVDDVLRREIFGLERGQIQVHRHDARVCRRKATGSSRRAVLDKPTRTWLAVTSNNSCSDIFGLLKLYCKIGTVEALYWMIKRRRACPGGIWRKTVCATAVICATAAVHGSAGLEKHLDDADAVVRGGFDVLDVIDRDGQRAFVDVDDALLDCPAASRPVYCQMMLMTGMLMAGKMSVGVRNRMNGVSSTSSSAATTKV